MRSIHFSRVFPLLILITTLSLAGCSAKAGEDRPATNEPSVAASVPTANPAPTATNQVTVPAPVESVEMSATENPGPFIDVEQFKAALLQALMDQDAEKLQAWMTEPFIEGGRGSDISDSAPLDALRILYAYYLGTENRLEWVKDVDLTALMGDNDPLSLPRPEAGVFEAALVSGWGKDMRDEAILFIARAADNSLKWHGWLMFNGGISGKRLGSVQPYTNETYGYRVYLPKDYEIEAASLNHVLVMAPGVGHPGQTRAAAFIDVEPANGRTVEEITEKLKADLGPDFHIPPGTAMGLDKAFALVLSELPGQDANRQLFSVYNDQLYHITFIPDAPQVGRPYFQMEDLYALIVNTFHFTN